MKLKKFKEFSQIYRSLTYQETNQNYHDETTKEI